MFGSFPKKISVLVYVGFLATWIVDISNTDNRENTRLSVITQFSNKMFDYALK